MAALTPNKISATFSRSPTPTLSLTVPTDLLSPEQLAIPGKLEFLAKQVVEGFITGLHKSPYHGFSVEFSEHRLYNTGESTKNIDWKLYARSEKVFVKRYEEETNLRCQLVIDASASMYFPLDGPSKLQFSVLASAAIMNLLYRQRDAVGLAVFDENLETLIKPRGSGAHHKLLMFELEALLQRQRKQNRTRAVAALHTIAEAIHRRSLVVIFSDMFDAGEDNEKLYEALQHLALQQTRGYSLSCGGRKTRARFRLRKPPAHLRGFGNGCRNQIKPGAVAGGLQISCGGLPQRIAVKMWAVWHRSG